MFIHYRFMPVYQMVFVLMRHTRIIVIDCHNTVKKNGWNICKNQLAKKLVFFVIPFSSVLLSI